MALILDDGFQLGQIDGQDFAFIGLDFSGYTQAGFTLQEYFYDADGNSISQRYRSSSSRADLTSLTVTEDATEVPEPAMLGLFGLATGRRRRA